MAANLDNQRFLIVLPIIFTARVVVITSIVSCILLGSILGVAVSWTTDSNLLFLWWWLLQLLKLALGVAHSQYRRPTLWCTSPTTFCSRFSIHLRSWRLLLFCATRPTALSILLTILLIWFIDRSSFVWWKSCGIFMKRLLLVSLPLRVILLISIVGTLALNAFLLPYWW